VYLAVCLVACFSVSKDNLELANKSIKKQKIEKCVYIDECTDIDTCVCIYMHVCVWTNIHLYIILKKFFKLGFLFCGNTKLRFLGVTLNIKLTRNWNEMAIVSIGFYCQMISF